MPASDHRPSRSPIASSPETAATRPAAVRMHFPRGPRAATLQRLLERHLRPAIHVDAVSWRLLLEGFLGEFCKLVALCGFDPVEESGRLDPIPHEVGLDAETRLEIAVEDHGRWQCRDRPGLRDRAVTVQKHG